MLGRLLASVGPLALTVVGGGAFAKYATHARWPEIPVSLEDAARATSGQIQEIVRYIEQSNPQLFNHLLEILARDSATIAALGASIAALTVHTIAVRRDPPPIARSLRVHRRQSASAAASGKTKAVGRRGGPSPIAAGAVDAYDARWGRIIRALVRSRPAARRRPAGSSPGEELAVLPVHRFAVPVFAAVFAAALASQSGAANAAKVTDCTKAGLCYCVNDEHKSAIAAKIEKFRQILAEQRKAGKAVVYLSVPLTSAGGGNFNVNAEVAEATKEAIEKRLGANYVYVLNPGTPDADLPKGSTGTEYMVMWTAAARGPRRPRRLRRRLVRRAAGLRPLLPLRRQQRHGEARRLLRQARAVPSRLRESRAKAASPRRPSASYYALRASSTVSRGAHDEWNIFRLHQRQAPRADRKIRDTRARSRSLFDGQGVAPPRSAKLDGLGGLRRQVRAMTARRPHNPTRCYARHRALPSTYVPLLAFALCVRDLPRARPTRSTLYSIWPENWARPMFEEFEKATGIKVNFVRFSSGEALARVIAEKNNPRVDVLFGGPVETFAAGIGEGVFEPYKPPAFAQLPARFKQADGSGSRSPTIRSCS